jgi:hypothetical protein
MKCPLLTGGKKGKNPISIHETMALCYRVAPVLTWAAVACSGAQVAVMAGLLLTVPVGHAGEIEPRAFSNAPAGINFLIAAYAHTDGGLSTVASSPIQDAQLEIDTQVLAYARTLDVWGKSGKFDCILPYSRLSGTAMFEGQQYGRKVSGLHDPLFRFSTNFYGAPALSLEEFSTYRQDMIIGGSVQVSMPWGQYDPDRLVNLGANRWFVKPELGISKALGALTLELSAGVIVFTENDDYFNGRTLEQDPVYTTQLHFTYNFGRGVWAAVSGTYDYGGQTTVNGVQKENVQSNSRLGATLALPVNAHNSIKLYASSGVATRIGNDYDLIGAAWQYRWGSGL